MGKICVTVRKSGETSATCITSILRDSVAGFIVIRPVTKRIFQAPDRTFHLFLAQPVCRSTPSSFSDILYPGLFNSLVCMDMPVEDCAHIFRKEYRFKHLLEVLESPEVICLRSIQGMMNDHNVPFVARRKV